LPVSTLLLSYFNSRLLPLVKMIRTGTQRRGQAAGRAGTDFWMPNPLVNILLERIFAGERKKLLQMLRMQRSHGYSAGASLIAVLRREEGPMAVRTKPSDVAPDRRL